MIDESSFTANICKLFIFEKTIRSFLIYIFEIILSDKKIVFIVLGFPSKNYVNFNSFSTESENNVYSLYTTLLPIKTISSL